MSSSDNGYIRLTKKPPAPLWGPLHKYKTEEEFKAMKRAISRKYYLEHYEEQKAEGRERARLSYARKKAAKAQTISRPRIVFLD